MFPSRPSPYLPIANNWRIVESSREKNKDLFTIVAFGTTVSRCVPAPMTHDICTLPRHEERPDFHVFPTRGDSASIYAFSSIRDIDLALGLSIVIADRSTGRRPISTAPSKKHQQLTQSKIKRRKESSIDSTTD